MSPSLSSFWVMSWCYNSVLFKGSCIGCNSLLATRDDFVQATLFQFSPTWTSQRGSLKVSGSQNNEISVEAFWRHDSLIELAKQSALSQSFFPVGVYGWWQHRFDVETDSIIKAKPFGQCGNWGQHSKANISLESLRSPKCKQTCIISWLKDLVWTKVPLHNLEHRSIWSAINVLVK